MLVCHLIPRFPYLGQDVVVGGAANALYNLVKQPEYSCEKRILAHVPLDNADNTVLPTYVTHLNITSPPTSMRFGISYVYKIVEIAMRKGCLPDIIHGHSGFVEYTLATALFSLLTKSPAVHSLYCPVTLSSKTRRLFQKIVLFFTDPYIKKYVAISENVARSLKAIGIPKHKIEVIHPIVDICRYNTSFNKKDARTKLGINPDVPVVLYVGNTKPEKNLDAVLLAFSSVAKELPTAVLIVTTELEHREHKARQSHYNSLIAKTNLRERIIWLPIVNNMPELMAASDVFLAPFLNTDGPSDYFQAALEAMSVGRPVIVSNVGGMSEVVDNTVGHLVDPHDIAGISDALITLLTDSALREQYGKTASERVRKLHNPTTITEQVLAVYASLKKNGATQ